MKNGITCFMFCDFVVSKLLSLFVISQMTCHFFFLRVSNNFAKLTFLVYILISYFLLEVLSKYRLLLKKLLKFKLSKLQAQVKT